MLCMGCLNAPASAPTRCVCVHTREHRFWSRARESKAEACRECGSKRDRRSSMREGKEEKKKRERLAMNEPIFTKWGLMLFMRI